MTDTHPTQAMDRDDDDTGKDAIGDAAGKQDSESSGGAYPNPHTGKGSQDDVGGGFLGHGGQSGMDYSGTGDGDSDDDVGNDNAVTK